MEITIHLNAKPSDQDGDYPCVTIHYRQGKELEAIELERVIREAVRRKDRTQTWDGRKIATP